MQASESLDFWWQLSLRIGSMGLNFAYVYILSYFVSVFLVPLSINPSVINVSIVKVKLYCEVCNLATIQRDGDLAWRQTMVLCEKVLKTLSVDRSQELTNSKSHKNKESISKGKGLG